MSQCSLPSFPARFLLAPGLPRQRANSLSPWAESLSSVPLPSQASLSSPWHTHHGRKRLTPVQPSLQKSFGSRLMIEGASLSRPDKRAKCCQRDIHHLSG